MAAAAQLLSQQPQRRTVYGSLLRPQSEGINHLELTSPQEEGDAGKKQHRGGSAAAFAVHTWQSGVSAVTWLLFTAVMLSVICRLMHGQWPAALLALGFRHSAEAALPRVAGPAGGPVPAVVQRHYCEDADPIWCSQALQAGVNRSHVGLHSLQACRLAGGDAVVTKCMRSCGICAILLSDCTNVKVAANSEGSCNEAEDVVGEVCSNDGDLDREGYCTWMPAGAVPQFLCGHCADSVISPERRAMMAQMAELRLEEDSREVERLQHKGDGSSPPLRSNVRSLRERDDLVVKR